MEDKNKESIVKNITRYSSSKIYMLFLGFFTALIRPKLLTPELFGLWNILNIIPTYASYIHLGARTSMMYQIPYYEGKNDRLKNRAIKGSVFWGSLYLNIFLMFLLVIFSFKKNLSLEARIGLQAMVIIVFLEWYYGHYMSLSKSYQNFKLISSSNYLKATVTFFLSVILIYFFSIYGVFLTVIISLLAVILYFRVKSPLESHEKFSFSTFKGLVKKGFPIMLFGISSELLRTSDRAIIFYFLGIEQLGYYGIAVMVVSSLIQIPGAAREVVEPRLMQNINENSNEENLKEYFFKPLINSAYLLPFLHGIAIIVLPLIIPLLLPMYIPGILPAQIIILGSYFFCMSYTARGIIVANNWQLGAFAITVSVLFINVILSITFLKLGLGITGVALGTSISFFMLFICLLIFVRKRCRCSLQDWKSNTKGLCLPFLAMFVIIIFLRYISDILCVNDFIAVFINTSLFCVIMVFTNNFARRKNTLLKRIQLQEIWKIR